MKANPKLGAYFDGEQDAAQKASVAFWGLLGKSFGEKKHKKEKNLRVSCFALVLLFPFLLPTIHDPPIFGRTRP